MKLTSIILVLAFMFMAQRTVHAQTNSIGVRLGEPLGITYKKYLPNNRAFEFGLGSVVKGWDQKYYRNSFNRRSKYDNYKHLSHEASNVVYMQARYLFQKDINAPELDGKLQWYWGVGALLKTARVRYEYGEQQPPFVHHTDTRTDIDFGPEVMIGLDYTFEDVPVTLFVEMSMMLEMVDRVTIRVFGGTGARFRF